MMVHEITVPFSDPAVERLGAALTANCTARHMGVRYWVVGAEYRPNTRRRREDEVVFRVSPAYFCHDI